MAWLKEAMETDADYRFEVCPGQLGRCNHTDPANEHRFYTWAKPAEPMTVSDMVREIRLLEQRLRRAPVVVQQLPERGRQL